MTTKLNKKFEKEYQEEISKVWQGKMLRYCMKQYAGGVVLNGKLIRFERPEIEKHFCFGWGMCSHYEDAEKMRAHAAKSDEYFLKENLKKYDRLLDNLKNPSHTFYLYPLYEDNINIWGVKDVFCGYTHLIRPKDVKMTEEEIKTYIKEVEGQREQHKTRCLQYLKRYGLKHIRTWTYYDND